jgi:hypothetical protein
VSEPMYVPPSVAAAEYPISSSTSATNSCRVCDRIGALSAAGVPSCPSAFQGVSNVAPATTEDATKPRRDEREAVNGKRISSSSGCFA